jgi:hypothetical protein
MNRGEIRLATKRRGRGMKMRMKMSIYILKKILAISICMAVLEIVPVIL